MTNSPNERDDVWALVDEIERGREPAEPQASPVREPHPPAAQTAQEPPSSTEHHEHREHGEHHEHSDHHDHHDHGEHHGRHGGDAHSHSRSHSRSGGHRRTGRRAALAVGLTLLGIVAVAAGTYGVLRHMGREQMLPSDTQEFTAPSGSAVSSSDNGRRVEYQGHSYVFNENRTNILCMGTDKEELGSEAGEFGTGGQADAVYLVSLDTETGETDVLAISRDSMVDIDVYDENGTYLGQNRAQLCLAYAFGDGKAKSCENMTKAVSRILYGVPINAYISVDLQTVGILADAVGGVPVTAPEDIAFPDGTVLPKGENITLTGDKAVFFVRRRDTSYLESNNARMERQKAFIQSFFNQAVAASKSNLQVPLSLFNLISEHASTDLNAPKVTYLASAMLAHTPQLRFQKLPGEIVRGEFRHAEYHLDEAGVYEIILDVFYRRAD